MAIFSKSNRLVSVIITQISFRSTCQKQTTVECRRLAILGWLVAHIFTLLLTPFASKMVNYLRHSETSNFRKNLNSTSFSFKNSDFTVFKHFVRKRCQKKRKYRVEKRILPVGFFAYFYSMIQDINLKIGIDDL